jgi:TRAP-type C4-dicarboxylate transport system permease small subunit
MKSLYTRAMDKLYWACIGFAIFSICATTTLVFVGTMARDLFSFGAMYSEQLSIMFAIQMTFYGAAGCYRAHAHLSLGYFVRQLSARGQAIVEYIVFGFFVAISCSMIFWGIQLVDATMFQHYAEFPWEGLKVGYIYSAVPISGFILLLFVIEQIFIPESRQFHGDDEHGAETEVDIIRRAQEGKV